MVQYYIDSLSGVEVFIHWGYVTLHVVCSIFVSSKKVPSIGLKGVGKFVIIL